MATYRPDNRRLAFVDPASGLLKDQLRLINPNTSYPHTLAPLTAATYTVVDNAGATVYGPVSATVSGNLAEIEVALPSGITVGKFYRAKWSTTITGETAGLLFFTPLWPIGVDVDQPLITTEDVILRHPTLSLFPSGQTSWENQILMAHKVTLLRLTGTDIRRQAVWSPAQLLTVETYTALGIIFRQAATFTSGPALEMAQHYETLAQDEWRALRIDVDTDGDNDVDANVQTGTDARFPGGPQVTR